MTLPSSGQITLNQVNVELGNSGTAQIDMNSAAVRTLFGVASGQIAMSNGYGKSNEYVLTNEGTINGQSNRKQITVSSFISSGDTIKVPSGFWVWSDSRTTPAMIIDIPCTVINEGKIIGKGGANNGSTGGPAIKINSGVSGVTITNSSGAYIAGGGGGGGQGQNGGGGGGAGGGQGGFGGSGGGGVLNATGSNGTSLGGSATVSGGGGGAGGGGAASCGAGGGYGGAGGRILPGSGGARGTDGVSDPLGNGGNGGSAGNAGGNATPRNYGWPNNGAGGGAGWGARGGDGYYIGTTRSGGNGGKAIDDSGVSYTLSNSGTIYGAT